MSLELQQKEIEKDSCSEQQREDIKENKSKKILLVIICVIILIIVCILIGWIGNCFKKPKEEEIEEKDINKNNSETSSKSMKKELPNKTQPNKENQKESEAQDTHIKDKKKSPNKTQPNKENQKESEAQDTHIKNKKKSPNETQPNKENQKDKIIQYVYTKDQKKLLDEFKSNIETIDNLYNDYGDTTSLDKYIEHDHFDTLCDFFIKQILTNKDFLKEKSETEKNQMVSEISSEISSDVSSIASLLNASTYLKKIQNILKRNVFNTSIAQSHIKHIKSIQDKIKNLQTTIMNMSDKREQMNLLDKDNLAIDNGEEVPFESICIRFFKDFEKKCKEINELINKTIEILKKLEQEKFQEKTESLKN